MAKLMLSRRNWRILENDLDRGNGWVGAFIHDGLRMLDSSEPGLLLAE